MSKGEEGGPLMPFELSEIRGACRQFRRDRVVSWSAVVSLALGIGISTVVFALGNWLLVQPVPGVEAPDRLALIMFGEDGVRNDVFQPIRVSSSEAEVVRASVPSLQSLSGYIYSLVAVATADAPARESFAEYVTADYFRTLGVRLAAGRSFTPEEDSVAAPGVVAVIGERLRQRLFGPDDPLNQVISVNGASVVVIGVAPPRFRGLDRFFFRSELWLPGASFAAVEHRPSPDGSYDQWVGRPRPDVTFEQVEAELDVAAAAIARNQPRLRAVRLQRGAGLPPEGRNVVALSLSLLGIIVGLVLLVACVNVANLLLSRATERQRTLVICAALGATPARLARGALLESAALAVVAGVSGGGLAWYLWTMLQGAAVPGTPIVIEALPMDWRVPGFALAAAVATAVCVGVVPALRAGYGQSRLTLAPGRTFSVRMSRLQELLCGVQLAVAVTVTVALLLFVQTLRHLGQVELGFDPEPVTMFFSSPEMLGYDDSQVVAYQDQLLLRIGALPGVASAAVASAAPFSGRSMSLRTRVYRAGTDPEVTRVPVRAVRVSRGFFETLGLPILRGRSLAHDRTPSPAGPREVVLSETAARQVFVGPDVIGRTISFDASGQRGIEYQVVGTVADAHWVDLTAQAEALVYTAALSNYSLFMSTVLVKSTLSPGAVFEAVQEAASSLDPMLPIVDQGPLHVRASHQLAERRIFVTLLGILALTALILASVGVYGVISRLVAQRRRELGIRVALGATRAVVALLVVKRTVVVVGLGLAAGALGSLAFTRVLAGFLYGVDGAQGATYVASSLVMVAAAVVAAIHPVRSALATDPAVALRHE